MEWNGMTDFIKMTITIKKINTFDQEKRNSQKKFGRASFMYTIYRSADFEKIKLKLAYKMISGETKGLSKKHYSPQSCWVIGLTPLVSSTYTLQTHTSYK